VFLNDEKNNYKECIISYKTAYINIFNILVLEAQDPTEAVKKKETKVEGEEEDLFVIYRHESFQLWESEVQGAMLQANHNFIIVNKEGMGVVALGARQKQIFNDDKGNERMLHSLES